jgi:aspartate/methionine/tyrosine aminotransferase
MLPDNATFDAIVEIAESSGAHLLVDEVYRYLEGSEADRLPAGAEAASRGISLGVMSKSFAMAGLRIGWLATRDRAVLDRCARFKDYTTICSSAPSEILALIGLRARDTVLARSRRIVADNLATLDGFFEEWGDRFAWVRPRAGSVGFPRLTVPGVSIDEWAAGLVEAEGVLLLPGSQFGYGGNHFRLGYGRTDLPAALDRFERHAARTLR